MSSFNDFASAFEATPNFKHPEHCGSIKMQEADSTPVEHTRTAPSTPISPHHRCTICSHPRPTSYPNFFRQQRQLGSGGEAVVHLYKSTRTHQLIAVKRYKAPDQTVNLEAFLLSKLAPHPNIVKYLGAGQPSPYSRRPDLLFEYCAGGNLHDWSKRHKGNVSEAFLWHTYSQLSRALAFLHHGIPASGEAAATSWTPIIHGDVKPLNVLLTLPPHSTDTLPTVKLADFGLSTYWDPDHELSNWYAGTWTYHAPERPLLAPATDIWALGVLLYYLARDELPFDRNHRLDGISKETFIQRYVRYPWEMKNQSEDVKHAYGEFLYRKKLWIPAPRPLDVSDGGDEGRVGGYSRPLNYWIMRPLTVHPSLRITAAKLVRYVPVVGRLVTRLVEEGYGRVLSRVPNGRDEEGRRVIGDDDSAVGELGKAIEGLGEVDSGLRECFHDVLGLLNGDSSKLPS